MTRGPLDDLITTFFPGDCRICAAPLLRAGALPVCERCLEALRPQAEMQPGLLCTVCGEALGFESERFLESRGAADQVCTPCRRLPPPFAGAGAYGLYAAELRALLGLFKFDGLRSAAATLAHLLAEAIAELQPRLDPTVTTLVTPVPLFRGKARERGFNQAAVLAEMAVRQLRRSHPEMRLEMADGLLQRVRATESQFGLNPRQRRKNLQGAFALAEGATVAGRDALLVDDIYTTGATARACAAVLRRGGARQVLVATVARAQTEAVALWDAAPATRQEFTGGSVYQESVSDRRR